jgi:lactate permease
MNEKRVREFSLAILAVLGLLAVATAYLATGPTAKFLLAFYPLLVVLIGVAFLRQGSLNMAFVGWGLAIVLAVSNFGNTPIDAGASTLVGVLKSFGIAFTVAATMLLIYIMQEAGALQTISTVIKKQVAGNELQALYIGVGFGSFLSALGVVTPALFPPLLAAMGFSQLAAISVAVLGYDPTTSFSLLSIPITLPSQLFGLNAIALAFKIAVFLPVISTGFAFAILWLVGGVKSMKKGLVPGLICGLALAGACLVSAGVDYALGYELIPIRLVGVIAGLFTMLALTVYDRLGRGKNRETASGDNVARGEAWRSFSPLVILTILAAIVSLPAVGDYLSRAPGSIEVITVGSQKVDLDVLSQIYTWIFIATIISIATLKPTRDQLRKGIDLWLKRTPAPVLTIMIYFAVSFVMSGSTMNQVLGDTLALVFGGAYIYVSSSLGFLGAIVGGSETTSNVLFYKIQKTAADKIGLSATQFTTLYGGHAVGGGVASSVTPSKINNAVATVAAGKEVESIIMRKHLVVAILLTLVTCLLGGLFISLGF